MQTKKVDHRGVPLYLLYLCSVVKSIILSELVLVSLRFPFFSTQCHLELSKNFPLPQWYVKSKVRVFSLVKQQVIFRLTTLGRKMARFQLVMASSWWITVSLSRHGMEKIMGSMFVTLQTALGQQSTKSLCFLQGIIKMMTVNILPQYLNVLKCCRLKNFGKPRTLKSSAEFMDF